MSEWQAKRFWENASVEQAEGGYMVFLDGRKVKTPAKSALVLPTDALARAIAAEWDAQEDVIDASTMPVTRAANSAVDKIIPQRAAVVDMLAAYGDSDLLCYRAEGPQELVSRQSAAWDPLLTWARETHGAALICAEGVMHVDQPADSLARLRAPLDAANPFALAGLHDLIALSGSLVIALAVAEGARTPADGWRLSRIDEDWQIDQWGEDEEASALAAVKERDFHAAARVVSLSNGATPSG